jgi:hypothetical protein
VDNLRRVIGQEWRAWKAEEKKRQAAERVERRQQARAACADASLSNYRVEEEPTDDGKVILRRIGLPIQALAEQVGRITNGWPRRVGQSLFAEAPGPKPLWMEKPPQLFAWLSSHLPDADANRLVWGDADDMVSEARFHAYLGQTVRDYVAVEAFPHFPPMARHYYCHPAVAGGDGSALHGLLSRFEPATDADADLIYALFLTGFWGGRPGQRPAFLVRSVEEGDVRRGRGAGKSTLVKLFAYLLDGYVETSSKEDIDDFKKRLLSPEARDKRVAFIDNIKSLKFSLAQLEAMITGDVISGRELFVGEGRRPNTLVWCLTMNGASLSKDLAERTVIITVKRPHYSPTWEEDANAYIDKHRWAIVGDCLAALRAEEKPLPQTSRWGSWERGVLSRVAEPAEAQKVIAERQQVVDGDACEMAEVRDHIAQELRRRKHDPDRDTVLILSAELAPIVNAATGEKRGPAYVTSYVRTLSIPELRKSDREGERGWLWQGLSAPAGAAAVRLRPAPPTWGSQG